MIHYSHAPSATNTYSLIHAVRRNINLLLGSFYDHRQRLFPSYHSFQNKYCYTADSEKNQAQPEDPERIKEEGKGDDKNIECGYHQCSLKVSKSHPKHQVMRMAIISVEDRLAMVKPQYYYTKRIEERYD